MVARNGSEALNQIASQIPDAMILDLMMPEVDGFEVLRCIRENEETSHIPVVILTAKYVTKEELAFLKYNNVQQLIQKGDINKNQLLNAVSRMVFPQEIEAIKQLKEPEQKPYLKQDRIISSNSPIILIVEDNPDNMLTIKALLDGYGEIIEASDGACGIEMAKKLSPHLILMDIALPGKSGIETLQTLRLDKTMQDIPVIAVSASAMKGDREHFIASGFNEYIPKPIDNKMFTNIIKKYLDIIT
jgi:CheY-like chemotaxis protein